MKEKEPLFSVLIANYNNGRYLQEAIDSVLAQTYTHWEVIIVDDGSTDNSQEIYGHYATNPRFHIFYNEKNMGCAYTKHQCMLHAGGEFCGYLDPDDALLPNALSVIADLLAEGDDVALAFSRYYICDEFLNPIKESRPLVIPQGKTYFTNHDYRAEVFSGFRREAYFRMGGLDTSLKAGVDADLYFRLEEVGKLAISHEITYKYRIFSTSITANWTNAFYWNLILRHNTCIRRGLPVEQYSLRDFLIFISFSHWDTRPYRIGKLLTRPSTYLGYLKRKRKIKREKLP
ncbi:MAG: glycosyltransferase family 2 protein [Bacteroidales bacterium]|nr:glycosyltransferase family 2 protein [Bacteroidales bacterium]